MLLYKGMSEIKDDVLGALKLVFSFDDDFRFDLVDQKNGYLSLYDGFPKTTVSYPCVIVTNATLKPVPMGIGEEFREYGGIGELSGKEFGGHLEFTMDFDCAAKAMQEREQLGDRVVLTLWWIARQYLLYGGIVVTGVQSSGETETDYGADKIFVNRVTMNFWVEWSEIINYDEVEAINIRMKEIMDIKYNSPQDKPITTSEAIDIWVKKLGGK